MEKHPLYSWGKYVGGPKTRWITLTIWVLLTVILSFTWPAVNEVQDDTAADLPDSSMSQQANKLILKEFPNDAGNPVLIVWHRDNGLNNQDYKSIHNVYKQLKENPLKNQSTLPPFETIPEQALAQSASKDGTSLVTPLFFDKNAGTEILQDNMDELKKKN